jgi:hypothetical protein
MLSPHQSCHRLWLSLIKSATASKLSPIVAVTAQWVVVVEGRLLLSSRDRGGVEVAEVAEVDSVSL